MRRRQILKALGAAGLTLPTRDSVASSKQHYDAVIVGAGVFGIWVAEMLHRQGKSIAVIDAVAPAHAAASSGGESRVTRAGYADNELYSEWAARSLSEWQRLSERAALALYHQAGVLWLHGETDDYVSNSIKIFNKLNIDYLQFNSRQLRQRYPALSVRPGDYGFLEPRAGALMARRAVQTLAAELLAKGVYFLTNRVLPITSEQASANSLQHIQTARGHRLTADQFVFACGPWLNKVCPEAMADRLFVTRQEVIYFAGGPSLDEFPVWADLPFYGIPSVEGRGFKVADDTHGPIADPDKQDRTVSSQAITGARAFLERRFPALAEQPILESRVCQYENSSNGDFIIDYHPGIDNVIVAGGGSGHGFKHGPAIGAHIAGLIQGSEKRIERFSLKTKTTTQKRNIQ